MVTSISNMSKQLLQVFLGLSIIRRTTGFSIYSRHVCVGLSSSHNVNDMRCCSGNLAQRQTCILRGSVDPNNNIDEKEDDEESSLEEKINKFLDTPFFNPNESNNWFANLVKSDYDSAEALYVGIVVVGGVIVSQEMLRIVKYGGVTSGGGGNLF